MQGRIWRGFERDLWWIGMSKSRPGSEFHKESIPCLKPLVAGHRTRTPTVRIKPQPHFLVVPHSSSLPQHLIGLSSIIQVREDTCWLPILITTINSQSIVHTSDEHPPYQPHGGTQFSTMAPAVRMSFQPTQAPPRPFSKHIVHILISINFGMKSNSFCIYI